MFSKSLFLTYERIKRSKTTSGEKDYFKWVAGIHVLKKYSEGRFIFVFIYIPIFIFIYIDIYFIQKMYLCYSPQN